MQRVLLIFVAAQCIDVSTRQKYQLEVLQQLDSAQICGLVVSVEGIRRPSEPSPIVFC